MYDVSAIAIATGRLAINFILRFSSLKIKGKIYIKIVKIKISSREKLGLDVCQGDKMSTNYFFLFLKIS